MPPITQLKEVVRDTTLVQTRFRNGHVLLDVMGVGNQFLATRSKGKFSEEHLFHLTRTASKVQAITGNEQLSALCFFQSFVPYKPGGRKQVAQFSI